MNPGGEPAPDRQPPVRSPSGPTATSPEERDHWRLLEDRQRGEIGRRQQHVLVAAIGLAVQDALALAWVRRTIVAVAGEKHIGLAVAIEVGHHRLAGMQAAGRIR